MCKYGFETIGLHKIEAGVYECAEGSWRALEKCGFIREGVLKEEVLFNGAYIDVFRYGLLRRDFDNTEYSRG